MSTRLRLFYLGLILSAPLLGQAGQSANPSDSLEQVRSRLLAEITQQSRYTCAQNITRKFYESDSKASQNCADVIGTCSSENRCAKLISADRLQLDVAIADNREIHAWPGAAEFSEEEIRDLVGNGGPFGSGDFAGFIANIFGGSAAIRFEQSRTLDHHTLYEYEFEVPQNASNYAIATVAGTITIAYSGSFLIDPQTEDLVELTVRTAELALPDACQAASRIRYQRVAIHGRDVLIPSQTDLRAVFRDGTEVVGVTTYSTCHEYASHSRMRFEVEDVSTKADAPRPPRLDSLPQGLTFQARIVTPFDSSTSAGQAIEAVLRAPLIDGGGEILAPTGSRIHGRLVRFVEYKHPHHYFEADIRLDAIEINGTDVALFAIPTHPTPPPGSTGLQDVRANRYSDFISWAPRNIGAFYFPQRHLNVHDWNSEWLITAPEPGVATHSVP
jgi:hypothetical protein